MIIRQMTKEDATEVAQIEKECFSQPWSTQGFIDALNHSAFFLVAEEAKQILGYVGMYVTVPEGEITNIVTGKLEVHWWNRCSNGVWNMV